MATFRVGDLIKEQPDGSRALQTQLTGSIVEFDSDYTTPIDLEPGQFFDINLHFDGRQKYYLVTINFSTAEGNSAPDGILYYSKDNTFSVSNRHILNTIHEEIEPGPYPVGRGILFEDVDFSYNHNVSTLTTRPIKPLGEYARLRLRANDDKKVLIRTISVTEVKA